jgi:hypothetical protein
MAVMADLVQEKMSEMTPVKSGDHNEFISPDYVKIKRYVTVCVL